MVWVPGPAEAGENSPLAAFTIPGPLHVPPGSTAARNVLAFDSQKGPAGVMVASNTVFTVMFMVAGLVQPVGV